MIIEMENLSHRFSDGRRGVDRVSLSIRQGAFVLIAGPNGSGKTTLLRHLNGLALPTGGTVKVKGRPVGADLLRARKLVGMVFQDADSQIVGETVREDVAFGPDNLGLDRTEVEERTAEALDKVGLSHLAETPPHLLSGGEKRRLAIADVLSMKPEIIVFDEPFSNLDYPGICGVVHQMKALHGNGHTLIVTSHDLEPVVAMADRLIIMDHGRVVKDGKPGELIQQAAAFGVRPITGFVHHRGSHAWAP